MATTPLHKRIEKIFEHDYIQENFSFLNKLPPFTTEDRSELLLNYSHYPTDHKDWTILFSQLSAFFEMGILFKHSAHKDSSMTQMFYRGETYDCKSSKTYLKLPKSDHFNVYKTSSAPLLKKLKLDQFENIKDMSCMMVKVSDEYSYILFSKKADPWLRLLLENLQKTLINYAV